MTLAHHVSIVADELFERFTVNDTVHVVRPAPELVQEMARRGSYHDACAFWAPSLSYDQYKAACIRSGTLRPDPPAGFDTASFDPAAERTTRYKGIGLRAYLLGECLPNDIVTVLRPLGFTFTSGVPTGVPNE